MSQLQFELVSPEKLIVSKAVAMVTVPGSEGDYGILAGHAPIITTVKAGVIDVYEQESSTVSDRIFVAGGFAEVTAERCTVLADEAVQVSKLDRSVLDAEVKALAEEISQSKTDADRAAAEAKLAIVQAKLRALS